ncbi:hypothetical protein CDL15_Pgr011028 [Punica granatum]|uniref:SHSP domain-containing protein n=1 Tax=Punica granatum TaxID=22663 RepID=A0A218XMR4_PUNGR|nr:hypothetical protein CDL15_Pgr011028 [Punica granatum]
MFGGKEKKEGKRANLSEGRDLSPWAKPSLQLGYNILETTREFDKSDVFDPFSLDLWDPFKDFPFPSYNSLSTNFRENSAFVNTRIDWKETPEAHVFKADLPGLKKEEVKVQVEDDRVLQISGERNVEKEDKNDTWHRVERSSGKFLRRFRLPENARMDQVKASMENGVLTVTVPKVEEKKPEVKAIEISG